MAQDGDGRLAIVHSDDEGVALIAVLVVIEYDVIGLQGAVSSDTSKILIRL